MSYNAGAENAAAKLDDRDVASIREAYAKGLTVSQIARDFDLSRRHVQRILRGEAWRPEETPDHVRNHELGLQFEKADAEWHREHPDYNGPTTDHEYTAWRKQWQRDHEAPIEALTHLLDSFCGQCPVCNADPSMDMHTGMDRQHHRGRG